MCIIVNPAEFGQLWAWFQNSVICHGAYPIPLFHGTCSRIESFYPFSHFGTLAQAKTAWSNKINFYTSLGLPNAYTADQVRIADPFVLPGKTLGSFHVVALRLENPIQLDDPGERHTVRVLARQLKAAGVVNGRTSRTIELLIGSSAEYKIRNILVSSLLESGHDGIRYINNHEQRGAMSFIILNRWQVAPFFSVAQSVAKHRNETMQWSEKRSEMARMWVQSKHGLV